MQGPIRAFDVRCCGCRDWAGNRFILEIIFGLFIGQTLLDTGTSPDCESQLPGSVTYMDHGFFPTHHITGI